MKTIKNIIELAQSRGSKATTKAGAKKYLLQNMPESVFAKKTWQDRTTTRGEWKKTAFNRRMMARAERVAKSLGMEEKGAFATRIEFALASNWPYRQSESGWAGGNHYVSVKIDGVPHADCESQRVWSDNGKWSGSDSHARFTITYAALAALGERGILQSGLVTLDAVSVGPREYKATWAKQSRGVSLTTVSGWIIKGFHSTAATLELARKQAEKARKKALAAAIEVRAAKRNDKVQAARYCGIWVSLDDSLAAGNCRPASESVRSRVISRLGGDVYAVRGDVLLGIVTESEKGRALRAIEAAGRRHAH